MSHVLLLEVDPGGRPSRLELTTPAGLLTLHPSTDGREIHGNVVTTTGEGVRPLAFAWGPDHELEVVGRPIATAVAVRRRQGSIPIGESGQLEVLSIGPDLAVIAGRRTFERLSEGRWRVGSIELEIDPDGLPVGGVRWLLEPD
jgi:hypothetical protein